MSEKSACVRNDDKKCSLENTFDGVRPLMWRYRKRGHYLAQDRVERVAGSFFESVPDQLSLNPVLRHYETRGVARIPSSRLSLASRNYGFSHPPYGRRSWHSQRNARRRHGKDNAPVTARQISPSGLGPIVRE